MSTFIINRDTLSIVGYVQKLEITSEIKQEHLVVNSAKDLEVLSLQQLTDLYNNYCEHKMTSRFKSSKAESAYKVYKALNAVDLSTLMQLDKEAEKVIEDKAEKIAQDELVETKDQPGKKVRKVRDSKLQRMKAAFLTKDKTGNYKQWTVQELMDQCGTSERITHVYISILRSPTDRFIMNIEKIPGQSGDQPRFRFKPNDETNPEMIPVNQDNPRQSANQ